MTTNEEPVPVAVVGAGNMGANHIRVYDELPVAELVEVVEPNTERAETVKEQYDVRVVDSVDELQAASAVTVAVPNELHLPVTTDCAQQGLDVLVEKPLAMTVEDAEAIVDVAAANDVVLQVGHIERFNPAVETLGEILQNEEIVAVEAHRLGPFNEHLTDESVVYDLMIHDLDVIRSLVDADVDHINALGTIFRSRELDHAVALMTFESGVIATTTSSHVTHGKVRTLSVTTQDAFIELDYQNQSISIQRRGIEQMTSFHDRVGYRTETIIETPYIKTREPLKNELEHFLGCVRTRKTPAVDGMDGANAVRLASRVIDEIYSH